MGGAPVIALGFVLILLAGAYAVAVLEAWVVTGEFQPAGPLRASLALLGQESLVPRTPDRLLFDTAPVLFLLAAVAGAAVLPLTSGAILIDLATGALFVKAAWAYVMVALVMAGWGPNGAYAMIGGWRFLGQLIAYSMLIVMPITAVAMRAQSLATTDIVRSQASGWNIVTQPLGFILFWLAAMALCFLPPFDLPTAPGELAGGVEGEYTGFRLAIFRLARLMLVLTIALAVTVFFLGGWLGPVLPDWVWTAAKALSVTAVMLAAGRCFPRFRSEHLLAWSWKFGIPLALANIAWVGVTLLVWG